MPIRTRTSSSWRTKHGLQMVVKSIPRQWSQQSPLIHPLPHPQIHKSLLSTAEVGAAVEVEEAVANGEEGEVAEEGHRIHPLHQTTIIIIPIQTRIEASRIIQIILLQTSLTRGVPNIQICLPVLAGPVLSTGRKAGELLTVPIPWSVSGSQ